MASCSSVYPSTMLYRSCLIVSVLTGFIMSSAIAHEVQVAEDVGATLHIEPNDRALAGTPTPVWFALTKAGGTVIPLADCDCRLTLYDRQATVLATPTLAPISAEGFQAIPSATVTFPEVGTYELRLIGSPQEGAQFTPFALSFEVTVASRAHGQEAIAPERSESPSTADASEMTDGAPPTAAINPSPVGENTASTETSITVSPSNPWISVAVWGGAVCAIAILWGIVGGSRSSGGEP
jgi:hypothetical protein